jgi:2-dehydro-3-deoxyglucarate aldolase/4-hydroxy-2-oxoheptanedioate aldolase
MSVGLTDSFVSELAAEAGNDFIWIEMEHSHLDLPAAMGHILAVRGTQTAPLVRVPYNDPNVIKPYLDLAVAGIVVPMIRSAEDTKRAVEACKYPPKGIRGFGPLRNMYGRSMEEYLEKADDEILVFVQIETVEAVRNLDEILATPGLDGICLGRNDLSGSMGKLGQHSDPEVLEAIDTVFAKGSQAGVYVGVSIGPNLDTVRDWYKKGVQWFALGEETGYISDGATETAAAVHALQADK